MVTPQACRIHARAERRLGELLAEMKEHGERAGQGERKQTGRGGPFAPTLSDLGIPSKRVYTETMKKKKTGRPLGRTHPEAFTMRLPKGMLATWRKAAKREGMTVAGLIRQSVADRITRTKKGTSR